MAVLAALLRGCARGRSPLLRLQMQVRGAGARGPRFGVRPRGGAWLQALEVIPPWAPLRRRPSARVGSQGFLCSC